MVQKRVSTDISVAMPIGEDFLVFPTDNMTNDELIDYLYEDTFTWFAQTYNRKLSEEEKGAIKNRYLVTSARRALRKMAENAKKAPIQPAL